MLFPEAHLTVRAVFAALLSIAAFGAPADAQPKAAADSGRPPSWRSVTPVQRNRARADSLIEQAKALQQVPGGSSRYVEEAQLYRRAAQLRGDDSAAVMEWRMAAWAYGAAGNGTLALTRMKQAAEVAMRTGDVERAVGCFIDAALIAAEQGRTDQIVPLVGRAKALLTSPLLAQERRIALERRLGAEPSLGVLVRE